MGGWICSACVERESVVSHTVIAHRCRNHQTGKHFTAYVCARCLEAGRETRVTCRSFTDNRPAPDAIMIPSDRYPG